MAAGAQHITFGDPDFFNGPAHALAIVDELHREFPALSYDATIKIEHLLKHAGELPRLRDTGCLFVTSAVESVDDAILARLDKGHTRADFLEVARNFRELGMTLQPTFVPFTPWTTIEGYRELLRVIAEAELVEHVAPIQLAIRLLIPGGSRLLELEDVREMAGAFDREALAYPWRHADARVDELQRRVQAAVEQSEKEKLGTRREFCAHLARGGGTWPETETAQRRGSRGRARARRCRISTSRGIAAPSRRANNLFRLRRQARRSAAGRRRPSRRTLAVNRARMDSYERAREPTASDSGEQAGLSDAEFCGGGAAARH